MIPDSRYFSTAPLCPIPVRHFLNRLDAIRNDNNTSKELGIIDQGTDKNSIDSRSLFGYHAFGRENKVGLIPIELVEISWKVPQKGR